MFWSINRPPRQTQLDRLQIVELQFDGVLIDWHLVKITTDISNKKTLPGMIMMMSKVTLLFFTFPRSSFDWIRFIEQHRLPLQISFIAYASLGIWGMCFAIVSLRNSITFRSFCSVVSWSEESCWCELRNESIYSSVYHRQLNANVLTFISVVLTSFNVAAYCL